MFARDGSIHYWTSKVLTVSRGETMRKAARIMEEKNISSLVIAESERAVGIITERDIARAVAEDKDPDKATVEDIMTRDPVTVRITEEPSTVTKIMLGHGFRHMPVVDENEKLVGIVSLRDLLKPRNIESVK
jgi:CBS domain-containing protein